MAGSRLEKVGTIFSRVKGLMRSGVIKPHEKPIWFDIYAAFPPKRDRLYVEPNGNHGIKKAEAVPDIFYAEDHIRARFYKVYGAAPRPLDLSKSNFVSVCQSFVEQYEMLQKSTDMDEDALFEETGKALLAKGIILRRRERSAMAPEDSETILNMKLTDMLAEVQQPQKITEEESTSENPPSENPPSQSTV